LSEAPHKARGELEELLARFAIERGFDQHCDVVR
jgi:hypothetical protein